MRGIERRIEAGLDPAVPSVASLFISRWDVAVADEAPDELRNRLGIAVGKRTYAAYRELLDSDRWQRLANEGARPQRLLWASTGTKDPDASDTLYIERLRLAVHGQHDAREDAARLRRPRRGRRACCPPTAATPSETLKAFDDAGIDTDALAAKLQKEGAEAFVESWHELLATIAKQRQPRGLRVARR